MEDFGFLCDFVIIIIKKNPYLQNFVSNVYENSPLNFSEKQRVCRKFLKLCT